MAMQYIDMTGKTEEEAISRALEQLGLDRDDVSVEILERAKSGFLGIGASPAKVRVTYGLADAPDAPAGKKPAAEKKAAPVEKKPAEKKTAAAEKKPAAEKKAHAEEKPVPAAEDLGEVCTDEKAQQITAFLAGLLQHMDSAAQAKVYKGEEGRYKVILEGEQLGQLIGRRGETLDAIQQLTNYAVNRGNDKQRVRVHVDAENYRLKREQSLESLANKVAAKVVKYKRSTTLEPMNAYERHVIHTALQEVPNITTYSMGAEPNRRVIVSYDKDKK